jgi:hypothetical protein
VIPCWGCGSKDFITVLLPSIFLFFGKSFSGKRDYLHDPLLGMRFKGFYHRLSDGVISFSLKTLFRQA